MQLVTRILDRFLPALFLGVGVMLLAAGLLTYAPAGLANLAAPGTNGPAVAGGPLVSSEPDALPGSPRIRQVGRQIRRTRAIPPTQRVPAIRALRATRPV